MDDAQSVTADVKSSSSPERDQEVLDARMEHQQLVTSFHSLAQTTWVSYGVFLTLNTLFATALAWSYAVGRTTEFGGVAVCAFHILVPLIGIFNCGVAAQVSIEIARLRAITNKRGRELEEILYARFFQLLAAYSAKSPTTSLAGCTVFGVLWLVALLPVFFH